MESKRPLLPVTMSDCVDEKESLYSSRMIQHEVRPSNHQDSSGGDQSFSNHTDLGSVSNYDSNNNNGHPDHLHESISLTALEDDQFMLQEAPRQDPLGLSVDSNHTKLSRTSSSGAVKNASKMVLAVAGRPWKSVKRRFARSDTVGSAASGHADYGTLPPSSSSPRQKRSNSAPRTPIPASMRSDFSDLPIVQDNAAAAASSGHFRTAPRSRKSARHLPRATLRSGPNGESNNPGTTREGAAAAADLTIVGAAETALRQVTALVIAAVLGAHFHDRMNMLEKMTEYLVVAWLTCVGLRFAMAYQERRQLQSSFNLEERVPLVQNRVFNVPEDRFASSILLEHSCEDDNSFGEFESDARSSQMQMQLPKERSVSMDELSSGLPLLVSLESPESKPKEIERAAPTTVVHPELDPYFVIDTTAGARVFPNATHNLFPLDTDYFIGHMLVLIRTPDTDDDQAVKGSLENEKTVKYFRNKQRRFEFQFQVRLKKVPKGRVYFACELTETLKMGLIQRAFVSAAMAFVKTTNANFHYSLTGMPETPDGRWESPHMAFPVEEGMNRVVSTPAGEPSPALGGEIYESDESIKRRKKGLQIAWNKEDTYTFSLWSAYVDFLEWRCLNLPGIRPFSLSNVIGPQPIILSLYELISDDKESDNELSKYHYRCNAIDIVRLEMCNSAKSGVGQATRQWLSEHRHHRPTEAADDICRAEERSLVAEVDDGDEDDTGDESNESGDERNEPTEAVEDFGEGDHTIMSEAFADELGEGIYVRSGDAITLRESVLDDEDSRVGSSPGYVTNGGGFAVLQDQNSCVMIIEKAGKSRLRKHARSSSRLIKSGDTVIFKLLGKGRQDDNDTRYLTIHRGWWLKWVSVFPKKNGHFTVHTHETEFADRIRSAETQSTYLTLGGSFWLRHKRWSRYSVGVATEPSVTYGGRMLGLHIPGSSLTEYLSDDGRDAVRLDMASMESAGKSKGEWMRPLQIQAYESCAATPGVPLKYASESGSADEIKNTAQSKMSFSLETYNLDVPAFVELINRVDRIRQHAYVVRVLLPESTTSSPREDVPVQEPPQEEEKLLTTAFVRLRTGRDLAQVMRVGLKWRNSQATPGRVKSSIVEDGPLFRGSDSPRQRTFSTPTAADFQNLSARSFDAVEDPNNCKDGQLESSEDEWDGASIEELSVDSHDEAADPKHCPPSSRGGKGRNLIGKIAQSVKTKTTAAARSTTKKVVSQSVKVGMGTVNAGKATVNAGKAILPIRPKKPPMKEPKSAKRQTRRQRASGLRVDVNSRSMRRVALLESHLHSSVLAGELSAPEQSCRTVSSMLSKMSAQPEPSVMSDSFSSLLSSLVESTSELDKSFLHGGALQVGVSPTKIDSKNGSLLFESLVARCLWESHWREEWCGLYEKGLVFYAPLTDSPCLELSFSDIKYIRFLDAGPMSPLAGYPLLVIETAWLCHYCAFGNDRARQTFFEKVEDVKATATEKDDMSVASSRERELAEARFWQGFQTAIQYSHSFGGGKWANVASGSKMKSRAVLNNRRMVFDLNPQENGDDNANLFVEQLLSTALSFSLDSLKQNPDALIQFLDATSQLRSVALGEIDRKSPQAFCLFANIYHCLLQHALLFSVNGPLHKRSFIPFMRTSCYEIGGDVFSLAELYSCVLRGNMSRPTSSRPPFIDAPKKSNAFRYYSLRITTPNTNFVLSTADLSFPRDVPVLNPLDLDKQLDSQAVLYIRKNITVDVARKQVILPKIFDIYRNDFASDPVHPGSGHESLRYCLRYLFLDDPVLASQIRLLLDDPASVVIKYHPAGEQYYSSIKRKTYSDASAAFHHQF